jgi:hypothetical protein
VLAQRRGLAKLAAEPAQEGDMGGFHAAIVAARRV